jgi:hypothetical protein
MRIVYVAETPPIPKVSKKEELRQSAYLLAQRLMHSKSAKRRAIEILKIELGKNCKAGDARKR